MSQDEIIAMGNEAALQHGHTYEPEPGDGTIEFLGSFAALVAAKEREACAQVCDEMQEHWSAIKDTALLNGDVALSNALSGEPRAAEALAAIIRARSKP